MLTTLSVDDIKPGHYVVRVKDQQGNAVVKSKGKVPSHAAIGKLKEQGIATVEVDLDKSDVHTSVSLKDHLAANRQPNALHNNEASGEDLTKAHALYQDAVAIQGEFVHKLRNSSANDLSPVESLSTNIIESIFDNPSALCCLTMIKDVDKYLLEHSINCSILMAVFADHLGYDNQVVEELTCGTLLMDTGMAWVPPEILNSDDPLTDDDWELIRRHVDHSVDLVERSGDMPKLTRLVIEQHHERIDGSGYPNGLSGDEVSPFARMAAIVDTYDAMISVRSHQKPLPPAVALKRLTKTPGLDTKLVKQFIACLGIYPVGSLVKLKSGRLALVVRVNPSNLLNPTVMSFYSIRGDHHSDIKRLDLSKMDDEIEASVNPGDFNLNLPKFFRDIFIHKV